MSDIAALEKLLQFVAKSWEAILLVLGVGGAAAYQAHRTVKANGRADHGAQIAHGDLLATVERLRSDLAAEREQCERRTTDLERRLGRLEVDWRAALQEAGRNQLQLAWFQQLYANLLSMKDEIADAHPLIAKMIEQAGANNDPRQATAPAPAAHQEGEL